MRRIALVGCSKKKLGKGCPGKKFRAGDIYIGANYKCAITSGISHFGCEAYYILSAKYGLLDPNTEICYYDKSMQDMCIDDRRRWAENVYNDLKSKFININEIQFVIFAGTKYYEFLKDCLNCVVLKYNGRHITFDIKEIYP